MEPPLASFAAMDERELGEAASMTVLKHLKEIKAQSVKHYGKENILGETEARETMLGVSFMFPSSLQPLHSLDLRLVISYGHDN